MGSLATLWCHPTTTPTSGSVSVLVAGSGSGTSSVCVTSAPCYLSGMLLLFWELLWGLLSLPELYRPRLLLRKKGKHPELGSGSGGRSNCKSGLGVLFGPNTLSSYKNIIINDLRNMNISGLTLKTSFSIISSCQGIDTAPVLNFE